MDNYIAAIKTAFLKMEGDFSPENVKKKAKTAGLNPDEYCSDLNSSESIVRNYNLQEIKILNLPNGRFMASSLQIILCLRYETKSFCIKIGDISFFFDIKDENVLLSVLEELNANNILPSITDFFNIFPLRNMLPAAYLGCE